MSAKLPILAVILAGQSAVGQVAMPVVPAPPLIPWNLASSPAFVVPPEGEAKMLLTVILPNGTRVVCPYDDTQVVKGCNADGPAPLDVLIDAMAQQMRENAITRNRDRCDLGEKIACKELGREEALRDQQRASRVGH